MADDGTLRGQRIPLTADAIKIFQLMAGEYSSAYIQHSLLNPLQKTLRLNELSTDSLLGVLDDPERCLLFFYSHYAFSKRGKDREELSQLARSALARLLKGKTFAEVLAMPDGAELWSCFDALCHHQGKASGETQNRGLLQGMLELAQEVWRGSESPRSIARWIADELERTGQLEEQFTRIVDIRGVGPKVASTFLRDLVGLYGLEEAVDPANKIFIQPVDRWLRLIAPIVIPEPNMEDAADWILAGKITKYSRRAGVSGIRFSMGTSFFGQRVARRPEQFAEEIRRLISTQKPHQPGDSERLFSTHPA